MSVNARRLSSGKVVYDVRLRGPEVRNYKRSFATRRQAVLFEAEERAARARGGWVDPRAGQLALRAYTDRWMEQRVNLRSRTRELYEGLLRLHILPGLGSIDIADLTPSLIRACHTDLVRAGRPGRPTVAKAYRLRRTILTTAVEDELITRNPCVIKNAAVERSAERPVASGIGGVRARGCRRASAPDARVDGDLHGHAVG